MLKNSQKKKLIDFTLKNGIILTDTLSYLDKLRLETEILNKLLKNCKGRFTKY